MGFTLVELMVSMAIISILATISAQVFRVTLDTREIAAQKIEVNEVARTALDFMAEELRSAYLSPDSVAPVVKGMEAVHRPRFAGLYRFDETTIGDTVDDDEDGATDEEKLNGLDDDGDGRVDEDLGGNAADLLHFVRLVDPGDGGKIALEEVSYGLSKSGRRLVRRGRSFTLQDLQTSRVGSFLEGSSSLLPPMVATTDINGTPLQSGRVQGAGLAFNKWGNATSDERLGTSANMATLAYDIRGLKIRYYYYDYNVGEYRYTLEWDSARETSYADPLTGQGAIFTTSAMPDSSVKLWAGDPTRHICNELEDAFPRIMQGGRALFPIQGPAQLFMSMGNEDIALLARKVGEHTDGLPHSVEITLYVQDRARSRIPVSYTKRVYLPNRNIGA